MIKYLTVILTVLAFSLNCIADTFTHKTTGQSFNGYIVKFQRGDTTQVRLESGRPMYIDLKEYDVQRNYLGRKNKVFTFVITDSVELEAETQAIEKGIENAANQGPLFILIDIDTTGGRIDLAQRICSAITAADNCTTIAYIGGEKFGGAFSAGAIIALACDKICIKQGASIGAASLYAKTSDGIESLDNFYGKVVSEKINSAWRTYCSSVAEKNNRPGLLVKAMIDKEIEVIEVVENGKRMFIEPQNKTNKQTQLNVWSQKGSLLTLSAEEAFKTGMADKLFVSREDLFKTFFAAKAQEVKSRAQLQARRQFELAKKKLDQQLVIIEQQKKQADILIEQINEMQGDDSISVPELNYRGYGRYDLPYDVDRIRRKADEIQRMNQQLVTLLNSLINNYEMAIRMTDQNADLTYYKPILEKGLKWAEGTIFQIANRPRVNGDYENYQ